MFVEDGGLFEYGDDEGCVNGEVEVGVEVGSD